MVQWLVIHTINLMFSRALRYNHLLVATLMYLQLPMGEVCQRCSTFLFHTKFWHCFKRCHCIKSNYMRYFISYNACHLYAIWESTVTEPCQTTSSRLSKVAQCDTVHLRSHISPELD